MPRQFRDLIVDENDHLPRITLLNRDGTVALRDVSVQMASPVAQEGDRWGAKEANLLLRVGDDGIPYVDIVGYLTEEQTNALLDTKANVIHAHSAGEIKGGVLPMDVLATNSTDYGTSRLRNCRFGTAAPGSLANGEVFFVYE